MTPYYGQQTAHIMLVAGQLAHASCIPYLKSTSHVFSQLIGDSHIEIQNYIVLSPSLSDIT